MQRFRKLVLTSRSNDRMMNRERIRVYRQVETEEEDRPTRVIILKKKSNTPAPTLLAEKTTEVHHHHHHDRLDDTKMMTSMAHPSTAPAAAPTSTSPPTTPVPALQLQFSSVEKKSDSKKSIVKTDVENQEDHLLSRRKHREEEHSRSMPWQATLSNTCITCLLTWLILLGILALVGWTLVILCCCLLTYNYDFNDAWLILTSEEELCQI